MVPRLQDRVPVWMLSHPSVPSTLCVKWAYTFYNDSTTIKILVMFSCLWNATRRWQDQNAGTQAGEICRLQSSANILKIVSTPANQKGRRSQGKIPLGHRLRRDTLHFYLFIRLELSLRVTWRPKDCWKRSLTECPGKRKLVSDFRVTSTLCTSSIICPYVTSYRENAPTPPLGHDPMSHQITICISRSRTSQECEILSIQECMSFSWPSQLQTNFIRQILSAPSQTHTSNRQW